MLESPKRSRAVFFGGFETQPGNQPIEHAFLVHRNAAQQPGVPTSTWCAQHAGGRALQGVRHPARLQRKEPRTWVPGRRIGRSAYLEVYCKICSYMPNTTKKHSPNSLFSLDASPDERFLERADRTVTTSPNHETWGSSNLGFVRTRIVQTFGLDCVS